MEKVYAQKQLEKIYQSIFDLSTVKTSDDVPQITDEGRRICGEAAVNPADLVIRNKDYFMKTA